MRLGASQPWPFALQQLTGQSRMDAGPLLDYFKPLHDWLIEENKRTNEHIGWNGSGRPYAPEPSIRPQTTTESPRPTESRPDITNIFPELSRQLQLKGFS